MAARSPAKVASPVRRGTIEPARQLEPGFALQPEANDPYRGLVLDPADVFLL
jgi:hypothetical protein